jgi:GNAT superfamily N-acetyltransferase
MKLSLRQSSFQEVYPIWGQYLWPGRQSTIKAVSPINLDLRYDKELESATPTFWALHNEMGEMAGVISGYLTGEVHYRSRGLYLFPAWRGRGASRLLFSAVFAQAQKEGCRTIWSLPRQDAWPAYAARGFERKSEWFTKNMEFGPNCVAICSLTGTSDEFDKNSPTP